MTARLSADGRAGTVLANGSMTTTTGGEGEIRTAMVKADLVECMVALPGQLFANTTIPACLWFLSKNKGQGNRGGNDRRKQVLFIHAHKLGSLIPGSRKQKQFSDEEIQKNREYLPQLARHPMGQRRLRGHARLLPVSVAGGN